MPACGPFHFLPERVVGPRDKGAFAGRVDGLPGGHQPQVVGAWLLAVDEFALALEVSAVDWPQVHGVPPAASTMSCQKLTGNLHRPAGRVLTGKHRNAVRSAKAM